MLRRNRTTNVPGRGWPAVLSIALVLAAAAARAAPGEAAWTPLFNGRDFDGLEGSLTDGGDWRKVFKIEDGTIHVVAPFTYGYLSTVKSYGHYRCRVQYRWAAGAVAGWNSGLLYHSSGPMPADNHWPRSLELQMRKGDAGSLWIFGGAFVTALQSGGAWAEAGSPKEIGGKGYSTVRRGSDAERDGWNQVELVVRGDRSTHILNGVVTFQGREIKALDATGAKMPLSRGAIRLQSEGAEVFFRNFEIQELDPVTGAPASPRASPRTRRGERR